MQINSMTSPTSNSEQFLPFILPEKEKIALSDPSQSLKFLKNVSFLRVDNNAFRSIVPRFWSSVSAVSQQDLDTSITPQSMKGKFIASLVEKGLPVEVLNKHVFTFSTLVDDGQGLLFVNFPVLPGSFLSESESKFKVLCVSEAAMHFEANLYFVLSCFGVKEVNVCILHW